MKNTTLALTAILTGLIAAPANADPMEVSNGAVYIAGNDQLTVLPDDGVQLACSFDGDSFVASPGSMPVSIYIPGAADLKIIGNDLYVASIAGGSPEFVKFDISACQAAENGVTEPLPAWLKPHVDLASGVMTIPCLAVGNTWYDAVMNRRGRSMNWRVQFVEPSSDCGNATE